MQNYTKTVAAYKKAALQGDHQAMCRLGQAYFGGIGVKRSFTKSYGWFLIANRAASKPFGVTPQFHAIFQSLLTQKQLRQAWALASKWRWIGRSYIPSGNSVADAAFKQGLAYFHGSGVKRSFANAVKCYKKSASLGNNDAICALAYAYYLGTGVRRNMLKSCQYFLITKPEASLIFDLCPQFFKAFEYSLTPKQMREARAWAKKWKTLNKQRLHGA